MIRLCCAAYESFPTQPLSVLARASERLTPPCIHLHHAAVQVGSGWSASETPRNNLTSSMKKNKHSKRKKNNRNIYIYIEIILYRRHDLCWRCPKNTWMHHISAQQHGRSLARSHQRSKSNLRSAMERLTLLGFRVDTKWPHLGQVCTTVHIEWVDTLHRHWPKNAVNHTNQIEDLT